MSKQNMHVPVDREREKPCVLTIALRLVDHDNRAKSILTPTADGLSATFFHMATDLVLLPLRDQESKSRLYCMEKQRNVCLTIVELRMGLDFFLLTFDIYADNNNNNNALPYISIKS
jgi:hypothetical protein